MHLRRSFIKTTEINAIAQLDDRMTANKTRLRFTVRTLLGMTAVVAFLLSCQVVLWPKYQQYRTARLIAHLGSLHDKDTAAHQDASYQIVRLGGGKASVGPLVEATKSPDRGLRFVAGWTLAAIGPDAADAVPALIEMLDDEHYVRQTAVYALGTIGPSAKPAVTPLLRTLEDDSWLIRLKSAEALLKIDSESARESVRPVLEELSANTDPIARTDAAELLRTFFAD